MKSVLVFMKLQYVVTEPRPRSFPTEARDWTPRLMAIGRAVLGDATITCTKPRSFSNFHCQGSLAFGSPS